MSGRRVLVTGASRGIGASLVGHYLAAGDEVAGYSRGAAPVSHERYVHFTGDIADESSVRGMIQQLRQRWGGLDVLINNAGVGRMNPMALTTFDAAARITTTNFLGTFLSTHAAVRLLKRSPAGRIVNLTTVAVPLRLDGESVYAASKSAVETFTRIVAREVAPLNITCNAVGPSPIRTHLTEAVPEETMDRLLARQAIGRWAETTDVVNVIDFFLRPESSMVTGQIVYLGGVS